VLDFYKTVKRFGEFELIVKKSKFIAQGWSVNTEEDALDILVKIKKQTWGASHHCFAYRLGHRDDCQKQSDDGEPGGTAGRPILEAIKNQGLTNTLVIVTRYYGGSKLGASGLIHAYSIAAAGGIQAAEPVYQVLHQRVSVTIDYSRQGRVEHELRQQDVLVEEVSFGEQVVIHCLPLYHRRETFLQWVTDITQGQCVCVTGEVCYLSYSRLPTEK